MIEQLLNLVKENAQDAVINNPGIPNTQNSEVIQTLASSISGGLQEQIQQGNVQELLGLFSAQSLQDGNGLSSNPIVNQITQTAIKAIADKFGLSSGVAGGIVASVLPGVIGSLIKKINNPNDSSMDIGSIIGSLTGSTSGSGFDFSQIGNALSDGKIDMNDIISIGGSLLNGGSGNKQDDKKENGPDLGGLLGGLFGGK
jgi:hypothetical protein